jgi:hypothetical protein
VTDAAGGWRLDRLLLRAGDKHRRQLAKQEKNAVPFVSWLIQGASNPRIQSPYSLAVARLIKNPRIGAGGSCDRLAALPPERFMSLIRQKFSLSPASSKDWEIALGNASLERIRLLADLLNIPLDFLECDL